jgi:hypothetical protein
MRRESEEEPVEEDGRFDADEFAAPESEETELADGGTWFEDGGLYVENEEEEADVFEDSDEPVATKVFDVEADAEEPEAPEAEPAVDGEPPADDAAETPAEPKEPREPIGPKVKAAWAAFLVQARKVELPGAPDTDLKRIGTVAAILLASIAVGVGAYLLGKGSGADVEQARLEGAAAGRQAGAIAGVSSGYPAGFARGRQKAFRDAYVPAYRLYFKRAFEQAGLDPPTNDQIEVPLPGPPP